MNLNPIPTQPVNSSNLAAVGYDAPTSTLAVVFKARETKTKGLRPATIYHYCPVPSTMIGQLLRAKSKNGYFLKHIRDRSGIETLLWCNCGTFFVTGVHELDCVAVERTAVREEQEP
jgi:hypothetical protein